MKRNRKETIPGPVEYRDGRPVFVVEVDGLAASFVCPRCGATNRHGLGSEGQTFGHRLSHCPCWRPRGYYLQAPPPGMVPFGHSAPGAPSGDPAKM
jgi:hypothetical protein